MSCSNQSENHESRQVEFPFHRFPPTDLLRYEYLANLRQTNVHLFYKVLMTNIQVLIKRMIPALIRVYKSVRVYSRGWRSVSTIFAHLCQS